MTDTDMTDTTEATEMRGWPTEETAGADDSGTTKLAGVEVDDHGYPTASAMRDALKAVLDPEIGINIVDLGLVYEVAAADHTAHLRMTLTSMGCPLTELLHQQCTLVLTRLPEIDEVDVEFVFTPPWSTEMIAPEAKEELRAMGFNV
jgi:metal-sulfur cluster biosynthetic enzyme